jgi:hypothetical protein
MDRYGVEKLAAYVRCQLAGQVQDLRLMLLVNGLVLQGECHSQHAKQLAQQFVLDATRVPLLANDIKVHIEVRALKEVEGFGARQERLGA